MTLPSAQLISDSLGSLGRDSGEPVPVVLSHELIGLLSEQMYGSPLKAIEELVVNAYDADAQYCKISVPSADNRTDFMAVYDNGVGMDHDAIRDLWNIGRSKKREEQIQKLRARKQIGKFGIGKLATYAVATRITYFSKCSGVTRAVTLDFERFDPSPTGQTSEVRLPVYEVDDPSTAFSDARLKLVLDKLHLDQSVLLDESSWTLVILENLKDSATIHMGRLTWVLQTAMPLKVDFQLQLNGAAIESAKENYRRIVDFDVSELPGHRLQALRNKTNQDWQIAGESLVSADFPSGITGKVIVTDGILRTGKSDDIMRSHGFFVKVRNRLVNEKDARFGLHELSHEVFNRFRADVEIDDLDSGITAPREGVGDSTLREISESVLNELFNEARHQFTTRREPPSQLRKEHEMDYVPLSFLEFPLADALSLGNVSVGAEADYTWFYLKDIPTDNLESTIQDLYSDQRKSKFNYEYVADGKDGRLVKFSLESSAFLLNDDHEVIRAYKSGGQVQDLLQDIATAEAILEVYLREADIPPKLVGEILEKRDHLLRSLARDHLTSVASIGQSLLDASNQPHELEVALVAAARAVGFVAKHIGGSDAPDGIATFFDHPRGERKITLEAKSSNTVPDLGDLDIGTIAKHVARMGAEGCLLVAPAFPGATRGQDAAIAELAQMNKVSCWTVKQLADVVTAAESRHISARDVLDIVLKAYAPSDVTESVNELLNDPLWTEQGLYDGILSALEQLTANITDARPTTDMVLGLLVGQPKYHGVTQETIGQALRAIASASKGAMTLREDEAKIHTSIAELRRRTAGLTGSPGVPRRNGLFRNPEAQ